MLNHDGSIKHTSEPTHPKQSRVRALSTVKINEKKIERKPKPYNKRDKEKWVKKEKRDIVFIAATYFSVSWRNAKLFHDTSARIMSELFN